LTGESMALFLGFLCECCYMIWLFDVIILNKTFFLQLLLHMESTH
jgi:hypothetical protein